jgi:putative Mg2+ transporter-C (MgtC) family protein
MFLNLSATDIAIRIILTVVAAAAIGFERGENGKAAGLRTILLVGLAACLAMIQTNLLLPVDGKTAGSFAVMDVMRLPLGILSGVGFIGAGAILRRNNMVIGVTTAATLWYVTVLGLLFGGGQLWVGVIGSVIGIVVVQLLRVAEARLPRVRRAGLAIRWDATRLPESELLAAVAVPGIQIEQTGSSFSSVTGARELRLRLRWRSVGIEETPPGIVATLGRRDGVLNVSWHAGEVDSSDGA